MIPVAEIKPNPRNARTHSRKQIRQIADSIRSLGFAAPILVDEKRVLLAGHARLEAAKLLGLATVPAVSLSGLSDAQKRALLLADNRNAQSSGWDRELLARELASLAPLLTQEGFEIDVTGFEPVEIDNLEIDFEEDTSDPADTVDPDWSTGPPVSASGDVWQLGRHRLLCGDARNPGHLQQLMGDELASMAFIDPPYNLRISDVVGRGRTQHREFAVASGELSDSDFIEFLAGSLGAAARFSLDGAVHFVCQDWRHVAQLVAAGKRVYGEMLNLAVWVKSNAGQGSFYRSQHELIGIFRVGDVGHLNNIQLGRHGRSRSNVWTYAGVNAFRAGRMDELQAHPTAKPVGLVADAIRDCSRRGDIVLDTFSGSGTTILAAERVGRRAYAVELDPRYVDVAIRRWQSFTRKDAVHAAEMVTFDERAEIASARQIAVQPTSGRRRK